MIADNQYQHAIKAKPAVLGLLARGRAHEVVDLRHPLLRQVDLRSHHWHRNRPVRPHWPHWTDRLRVGRISGELPLRLQIFGSGLGSSGDEGRAEGSFHEWVLPVSVDVGARLQPHQLLISMHIYLFAWKREGSSNIASYQTIITLLTLVAPLLLFHVFVGYVGWLIG